MANLSHLSSLNHILQERAAHHAGKTAFVFLSDGDEETQVTYAQLDSRARAIAAHLQALGQPGDRALLLYPSGLQFIESFWGCLYAGMVAVPAYPPRNARHTPRIQAIAADAQARFCLSTATVLGRSRQLIAVVPGLQEMEWVATDELESSNQEPVSASPGTLAYLQYTSGSTSTPKGVMVSHGNLIHNLSFIFDQWGHSQDSQIVSWLPFFHDMGLIYGVLQPIYGAVGGILLAPASFLQQPFRWLHAISRFRADSTIAPNFAYELCTRKVTEQEKATLDLSHWHRAHNAAEPVRAETLERFAQAFECCGFRREALKPAYGLAEATLAVTYLRRAANFRVRQHPGVPDGEGAIGAHSTKAPGSVVGCGEGAADQRIIIVDPKTKQSCPPERLGEIWISGPSVAGGYWKRPSETEEMFQARTAEGDGPFLRTGDLGFLDQGELFITGRVKDLIIIRGANYYPQDIEATVQRVDPALQWDGGAAFSIADAGAEQLVVVQELVRHAKPDPVALIASIREAIAEEFGLHACAISLLKPLSLPKTSSGKIQRRRACEMFLDGTLEVVAAWSQPTSARAEPTSSTERLEPAPGSESMADQLRSWLIRRLAETVHLPPSEIDPRQPFARHGLDSLGAATLAAELGRKLDRSLPATLLFDFPTVDRLIDALLVRNVPHIGQSTRTAEEPIAVVGLACRFPGARNRAEFWRLLRDGTDAISEIPSNRWNVDAFYDPVPGQPGKMNTRSGGFLDAVDQFDPEFFEITPREAIRMDPQQRLLLEVSWEALEEAGFTLRELAGSNTGVFVGLSTFDYSLLQLRNPRSIEAYDGTGIAHSVAANRLSYFFDLRGPSAAIDTACSSSAVALHQACETLRRGESDLALAGGVNLILTPEILISLSHARMLAPDGRCKTFDSRADGYARGEGCGMAVLMRLSDALHRRARILALVRGSAVNQDGHTNGLTAPSGPAQEAVITGALRRAAVEPESISYVECHGTGTALGDPQEVEALRRVFGDRRRNTPCWIGSVKTNVGHLEAAAGIAGLCKVVLALAEKKIPPHIHLRNLNPLIPLAETPFQVPTTITDWAVPTPRRAGLSSFGFGGTNCHLVLEEAPPETFPRQDESMADPVPQPELITLSAKTESALKTLAGSWADTMRVTKPPLADVSFTSTSRRSHFDCRLAVITGSEEEACNLLRAAGAGEQRDRLFHGSDFHGTPPGAVFLFPGEGIYQPGVEPVLCQRAPRFRDLRNRCAEAFERVAGRSLEGKEHPGEERGDRWARQHAQLLTLGYSLAGLWRSWGIEPVAVCGYGLGELTAAVVSGVMEVEAAMEIVVQRAQHLARIPVEGAMATVFANEELIARLRAKLPERTAIAASHGPRSVVVSGERQVIEQLRRDLEADGAVIQLHSESLGLQSSWVEPILEPMAKQFATFTSTPPRLQMVSCVTATAFTAEPPDPSSHWVRHLRDPIRFDDAVELLTDAGERLFLECGTGAALTGIGRRLRLKSPSQRQLESWVPSLKNPDVPWLSLLEAVGRAYCLGADLDWREFSDNRGRLISLPTYPFQRERYWIADDTKTLPTPRLSDAGGDDAAWSRTLQKCDEFVNAQPDLLLREKERLDALNELSLSYMLQALEKLNVPDRPLAADLTQAADTLQIALPQYGAFQQVVRNLERADLIRREADRWSTRQSRRLASPESLSAAAVDFWRNQSDLPQFVSRCGASLPDVLRGQADPLTVLFPGGASDSVAKIYRDTVLARYYNGILRMALESILSTRPEGPPIRILEIGAGTGATTGALLPALEGRPAEYVFTDVGAGFVEQAQRTFSIPLLRFQLLDIEADPHEQGLAEAPFDVVIAANVLHATARLRETLRHVRTLLRPGGFLLLWEATIAQPWLDLTFGLLAGWNRFAGDDLRVSHPLLSAERWRQLLLEHGFKRANAVPSTSDTTATQHVLIAQADTRPFKKLTAPPPDDKSAAALESIRHSLYQVGWTSVTPPPFPPESSRAETWLLFADDQGVAARLAAQLSVRNIRVLTAESGAAFEALSAERFRIRPGHAADFARLIESVRLTFRTAPLRRIIHLWSLNSGSEANDNETWNRSHAAGVETLLEVVKYISAHRGLVSPDLVWGVTQGVQWLHQAGDSMPQLAGTPLWGFSKVAALEHPPFWGGMIDVPTTRTTASDEVLLRCFLSPGRDREVVIREERLFHPRLERLVPATHPPMRFNPDAAYLITGGLGGLGLAVARWLAARGARRLILTTRSPLPPKAEWDGLMASGSPLAGRLWALRELETTGVAVDVHAVDFASPGDTESWVAQLRRYPAPIRGAIHAAGVLDDQALVKLDPSHLRRVLAPKVSGGWILHEALADEPLDFLLFFSSVASLLGSRGQANHAAANAFLDGLARYRRARGQPAQTIHWGPWGEIGAAASLSAAQLESSGVRFLTPDQGLAALDLLLQANTVEAAAVHVDWDRFSLDPGRRAPLFENLLSVHPKSPPADSPASSAIDKPGGADAIVQRLAHFAGELMMLAPERVQVTKPLSQLGLDSLMAVQFQNEMELHYNYKASLNQLLHISLRELAERIAASQSAE